MIALEVRVEVMAALEMQLAVVMVKVLVAVLWVFVVVVGAARVVFTVVVEALEFMVVGGSSNGVGSCGGSTAAQLRRQLKVVLLVKPRKCNC